MAVKPVPAFTQRALEEWTRGWRGPLFAALVALAAGLPGLIALPPLDRDEARFAQSSAQMLESGDYIGAAFQDQDRSREPPLLHWLQAASVTSVSSVEARAIWAYRIPSLLGAMLAAAACAWGAAGFVGSLGGAAAGAVLASCLMLSIEAGIGKPDALLCGLVTVAMVALGRIYEGRGGLRTRLVFWLAVAAAALDKGLAGPLIVGIAALSLWAWDRRAPWLGSMGWVWGLLLTAALVGPWLAAVTIRTDGEAWLHGLAAEQAGLGPGMRPPPGLHLLAAPLLLFPFAGLALAGLAEGWKARATPAVRFALCWLVPNWLLLEVSPTRLIHEALPLYGALAWLAAFALTRPWGAWTRGAGAALSLVSAVALSIAAIYLARRFGDAAAEAAAWASVLLALAAGVSGALIMADRSRWPALAGALGLGLAAHGVVAAGLAPRLEPLWLSQRVAQALDRSGLNPRSGLTPGPVSVAGFAEPSLVFALGTGLELGDADDAALAISLTRPAVVEAATDADFQAALAAGGWKAEPVARVDGLDYVTGKAVSLRLYRSQIAPTPVERVPPPTREKTP